MIISFATQCLPTVKVKGSLCPLSAAKQDVFVIEAEVPDYSVSLGHCECPYSPALPACDTQLIILNPGGASAFFLPHSILVVTTPPLPVCSWYQGVTGLTECLGDASKCPLACQEAVNTTLLTRRKWGGA